MILVRRRDDADVNLGGLRRTEPLDFTLLQDSEDFGLGLRAHVGDFVEEDRAAVGELELAGLLFGGAREGAALVAEELRLDELLGNRRAVHLHEPFLRAEATPPMDGTRDQFLADTALAVNQHGCVGRRGALDLIHDFLQRRALAHQLMPRSSRADTQRASSRAATSLSWVEALANGVEHVVLRERLLDEPERAEAPRFKRGRRRPVRGDDDDRQRFVQAAQPAQNLESVEARHFDVEKHQVRMLALDDRQPLGPGSRHQAFVALVLENHPHRVADGGLVVNDEDARLHGR